MKLSLKRLLEESYPELVCLLRASREHTYHELPWDGGSSTRSITTRDGELGSEVKKKSDSKNIQHSPALRSEA